MKREKRSLDKFVAEHDGSDGDGATSIEAAIDGEFVETDETTALRDRIDRWLSVPRPVHLVGPTGCGKTALALSVATERDRPTVWIDGDEGLDTASLVGTHAGKEQYTERDNYVSGVLKKKSIVRDRWVDNPLSVAVRSGATLVYNEFSRTKPAAHNPLLSVLEEGVLERAGVTGEDRLIEVDPEFRVIFTSNSAEYAGVHRPQDALLDRLVGIHLDYYGRETERKIVGSRVSDLDDETIDRVVDLIRDLREEVEFHVGTRSAVMLAEGLRIFPEDRPIAETCIEVLGSKAATAEEAAELRETIEGLVD
ncbi:gas vesicle protein GvpN [Natronorarus salvus]|uniref:gas vesicle protein GvpN n=1 Tax=Natronorarus salvus TaxID=3117733 RepID=UPI002F26056C